MKPYQIKDNSFAEKEQFNEVHNIVRIVAAKEYRDRAEKLPYNGFQDIGERRELRIECQERFGLTEGEAINILNGYNMRDIVQVYENIRDLKLPNEKDVELYLELMQQKDDGNEVKEEKEDDEDDEV